MSELGFIHVFVPGESNRTLLLLHGTGGNEEDLLDLGREIDPEAGLLSPRGKILENGAPRFFRRLAEGVFDEEDVVRRAKELAAFVENAAQEYKIDLGQLIAIGYSNGANIAAAMFLLGIAPFTKAILFRPMVPLSQLASPNLKQAAVLLSGGQFDPIARPPIVQKLGEILRQDGAAVDVVLQPSGHELTSRDLQSAKDWLTR